MLEGDAREVLSDGSVPSHAARPLPVSPVIRARLHALIRLLWLTGCRITEALSVRTGDIDSHLGIVTLRNLKRKTQATKAAPLPASFVASLLALGSDMPDGQLFPWTRCHAFALVRNALVAAGVDRPRAHPHAIRHGHAVHALKSGAPLNIVQQALGHASVATTSIYLRVTGADVRRAYDAIAW